MGGILPRERRFARFRKFADFSQMDLSWGLQFNSSGQAYPAARTAATIFPEKAPPVAPSVAA